MAIVTYSPEDVIILLGGVYQVEGLVEGGFVSISESEGRYKTSVTSDGKVSRTHINNPTHDVTITTMSTADVNNIFTAWAATDGLLYGAMFPLFIKDAMGTSMFYAPMSWIEAVPSSDFTESTGDRPWVIKTAGGIYVVGGNGAGGVFPPDLTSAGMLAADFAGLF